jgi:hypothetical protein
MFTHKAVVSPSPYCIGNGGQSQIISDVLFQHGTVDMPSKFMVDNMNSDD